MAIIETLLVIALIGVFTWLIVTFVPMPSPFQRVIVAVAVILTILWLLGSLGAFGPHWVHS